MTPAVEQPKRKRVPMQQPVGACDAEEVGLPKCARPAREWTGFHGLCRECGDALERERQRVESSSEAVEQAECEECGAALPYGGHVATPLCDDCLDGESPEEVNQPIGRCDGCNSPVYIEGGFCGVCHPRFL